MAKFNRFIDGVEFIPLDSDWTPYTPSQLLAKLGVRDAPKRHQREAVADWLGENQPTTFLRMCLEDDGLIAGSAGSGEPRHSAA